MVLSVNESKSVIRRNGQEPEEVVSQESDDLVMNRVFIEAARQGRQDGILSSYADAARTLAVTLACQRSAEIGQPIELAEFMALKVH
ncbi:MAG TPA: hypothetical protein VNK95_20705, partial [Caldilineaceae bacterium]|nr:hypothetical protein [Caldilineaceae bacterium]